MSKIGDLGQALEGLRLMKNEIDCFFAAIDSREALLAANRADDNVRAGEIGANLTRVKVDLRALKAQVLLALDELPAMVAEREANDD